MTSSRLEMVERKGSEVFKEASWASWDTEAQQSPTITTLYHPVRCLPCSAFHHKVGGYARQ